MPNFPILFTVGSSNRHEVILISSKLQLPEVSRIISSACANSPNNKEIMAKYKKGGEKVGDIKVKWSMAERDAKIWPKDTILTDDNFEAVMRLIEDSGVGKDVLEVTMVSSEE